MLIKMLGTIVHRRKSTALPSKAENGKYLFIRQDRIGDVLVSTPLFRLLKLRFPNATIDVLLSKNNEFVLANNPHIRKRWIYTKKVGDTLRLIHALRKEHYDYAIDLIDNPSATSTIACLLSGARTTIGLDKENSYAYDISVPLPSRKETHIVERLAQLLTPFGISPGPDELIIEYFPSNDSRNFANQFLGNAKLKDKKLIGINISAGGNVRFWGVENFKKLIRYLENNYPAYQNLLLYNSDYSEKALEIGAHFSSVTLSPITHTFDQFAALIEKVELLITPDTSAVHLAAAFSIPSVVLYVQSNPNLRIWEPYRTPCEPVVTNVDDLTTITVEEVIKAVDHLFKRTSKLIS